MASNNHLEVKVWDPLVRLFHWSLVLAFALAWISADEWETLHVWAGYFIAGLVGFRLVWGLIGTRHARFTDFVYRWSRVKAYLKNLLWGPVEHFKGHNPAGGLMVLVLLATLAVLVFSGMLTIGADGAGPLAGTLLASLVGSWMEDIHEFFANFMILLVVVHIAGVLFSSLVHKENLIRAMVTGKKQVKNEVKSEI